MANEIRLRQNNEQGVIVDNPLLIGATTINGPGFISLPVVSAANHLLLTLDPQEVGGTAEIVRVTAHTAASSVITVIRGSEGTVARQHANGTTWMHGPVVSDFNYTQKAALSTNRPTAPTTGELIYETDTALLKTYSGSAWADVPADTGWLTPTLLNGWVVYDATYGNAAMYRKIGKVVYIRGLLKNGTAVAGTSVFNLPAGFRPSIRLLWASVSNNVWCSIGVNTTGDVIVEQAVNNTYVSLTPISFPADA